MAGITLVISVALCAAVVALVALATYTHSLRSRLRHAARLAHVDHLTGVPNRRALHYVLDGELSRAERYGTHGLCVAMFDVDHFKRINDLHGHAVGDSVLAAVAECVQAELRGSDYLFRLGGDEFVIMTTETQGRDAVGLAVRIGNAVEQEELPGGVRVTLSLGVAEWKRGDSPAQLLKRADNALYVAKGDGRNTVVCLGLDERRKLRSIIAPRLAQAAE